MPSIVTSRHFTQASGWLGDEIVTLRNEVFELEGAVSRVVSACRVV